MHLSAFKSWVLWNCKVLNAAVHWALRAHQGLALACSWQGLHFEPGVSKSLSLKGATEKGQVSNLLLSVAQGTMQ